jgi:2-keto-4-pentenoate hydratase/2-oxohepta-3-ene-1,7-dioic acid hydratase in catechol pathway
MRLCRFDTDRLGVLRGDRIVDVTSALDSIPAVRWPLDPGDLLISNLDRLRGMIEHLADEGTSRHLADCALKSPVANPSKIIGAPKNYSEPGATEQPAAGVPVNMLERDGLFIKATTAIGGPSDGIELTMRGREVIHEVELAAVIGSWCRNVTRERALDHVAGYTIAIDMSARDFNQAPDQFYKFDWVAGKATDTSCPIGPWIVPAAAVPDPQHVPLKLSVNGTVRQDSSTQQMIYSVAEQIARASELMTLDPGDVVLTGTPAGVGVPKGTFLAPGDRIDAEIAGIGRLSVEIKPPL